MYYFIRGNRTLTFTRVFLIAKPEHILLQDNLRESHIIIRNLLKMKLKLKMWLITKKKICRSHEKQRASLLIFKELIQINKKEKQMSI